MSGTGSRRHDVAPTDHEGPASRTADPSRGTDGHSGDAHAEWAARRRLRFERSLPMPADRHE
jgi:hypothetical protein